MRRRILLLLLGLATRSVALPLDGIAGAGPWGPIASDDVGVDVSTGADGAVSIRWDYRHHAGYAGVARALPIEWPDNFELELPIAGDLDGNVLELKFADASNHNVWWVRRVDLRVAPGGTTLRLRRREVEFAWGPASDHTLRNTARLELVVTARSGRSGRITVGPLTLEPRPLPPAVPPPAHVLTAAGSVALPDAGHPLDVDQPLVIDWGAPREIGGVRLEWRDERPRHVRLESSSDGVHYTPLATSVTRGRVDWRAFAATEDRYWRLAPEGPVGELLSLTPAAANFGEDPNRRWLAIAHERPRGEYPRGFLEQTAWTIVGEAEGGTEAALLSEDGSFEPGVGAPSIEPFVRVDGVPGDWARATTTQSLAGGDLPLPRVTRRHGPVDLLVDALNTGRGERRRGVVTYRLVNTDAVPHRVDLDLRVRPFQVNPPAQFLNVAGGASAIRALDWDGSRLSVDTPGHGFRLTASERPASVVVDEVDPSVAAGGPIGGGVDARRHVSATGEATGLLRFTRRLGPHQRATLALCVDAASDAVAPVVPCRLASVEASRRTAEAQWTARLHRVTVDADAPLAHQLRDAIRTAHAHLLIEADGPWLRPGTRSYARAWIRDGAMMSAGLLRLGETRAPLAFFDAWAGILYSSGKVPCCHDERGADPVPENDSTGEFLYLAAQLLHQGGREARAHVQAAYPKIRAAMAWLEAERARTRAPAESPDFSGLLPASISHEGYSAQPMHSYWDDFWGLRGVSDAIDVARTLGHPDDVRAWTRARADFAAAVAESLRRTQAVHGIDTVPGAADLGDFDPTSTTIALSPGTGGDDVPLDALRRTFDRYWQFFTDRRDGRTAWDVYTPYEWRNVGALLRLGERQRAFAAFEWFFAARRPSAWNQWPEVVTRDPAAVRFIGDLPHGWVASDFLRAALDFYAYDDPSRRALVLGAGVPAEWLRGRGVRVTGLATPYGTLSYTARVAGATLAVDIAPGPVPPGGLLLRLPGADECVVTHRPAHLRLSWHEHDATN